MPPPRSLWLPLLTLALTCAACADPHTSPDLAPTDSADADDADDAAADTPSDTADTTLTAGPLALLAIEPTAAPVGSFTDILIHGAGFAPGLDVLFGATPSPDVRVLSATTARARLPAHPAGLVSVTLQHLDRPNENPTLSNHFRFTEPFTLTALTPTEGPTSGATPVTITAPDLPPDARLFLNGRPLLFPRRLDASTVTGLTPPGSFGPATLTAVSPSGQATLPDAFFFSAPPELTSLTPLTAPPSGGLPVTLTGAALPADATVLFDTTPAPILHAAPDATSLVVLAPLLTSPGPIDVHVTTRWGTATLPLAFAAPAPTATPTCTHLFPTSAPLPSAAPSTAPPIRVTLACQSLPAGPLSVTFGPTPATDITQTPFELTVTAPTAAIAGPVPVTVHPAASPPIPAGTFTFTPAPEFTISSISPSSGELTGQTRFTLYGRGFLPGLALWVGALPATSVAVAPDGRCLTAFTPPGVPGLADVRAFQSGLIATLPAAFTFTAPTLSADLLTPPTAARSGGARLHLFGTGFTADTTVLIGPSPTEILAIPSPSELILRAPRLPVGLHDLVITTSSASARLPAALLAFDPRSGSVGSWGDPIAERVNVTVWGTYSVGPVADALVIIESPFGPTLQGLTDSDGQLTLTHPALTGPVTVTASRDGFTTYSVVSVDAENITVPLTPNPIPPPQGGGPTTPPTPRPNATLSGHVTGFDKYVVAPPASCAARTIPGTAFCAPCDPALPSPCGLDPSLACLPFADEGTRCLATCVTTTDCPAGYACGPSPAGARCLPSLGERKVLCNISSSSPFGYEYAPQPTGWADATGAYSLDSLRLGELAVYCLGGYLDLQGLFTPTVLGLHRHIFAASGATLTDIDVTLDHPLDRSFRFRLQDPPAPPQGMNPPALTISLDLGADGVLPFSRRLLPVDAPPSAGPPQLTDPAAWVAPNQLARLSGDLYDAHYLLYTTLSPYQTPGFQPRSFNLIQHVDTLVEDRLPRRLPGDTAWSFDRLPLQRDLHALWQPAPTTADPNPPLWAVGEAGTLLLRTSAGWTLQPRLTPHTLTAISGPARDDLWIAGHRGTLFHSDGIAWTAIPAPDDDATALLATDDAVYLAGMNRLRRLDRHATHATFSLATTQNVQHIRDIIATPSGTIALGRGTLYREEPDLSWTPLPAPTPVQLRAALTRHDGTFVVVGDRGTVLSGPSPDDLTPCPAPTRHDLTTLVEDASGKLFIFGDEGVAFSGTSPCDLSSDPIPNYRAKVHASYVTADGTLLAVGSAAFTLGPFLDFPRVTSPSTEISPNPTLLSWTFDRGPAARYTRLALTPTAGPTLWTLIVDGPLQQALLPDLRALGGLTPLPSDVYRFEILRVLNPNFDIDAFSTRDFSLYARDAWATHEVMFTIAP